MYIVKSSSQATLSPQVVGIMVVFILGIAVLAVWYGRTR
jgi:hypothetical protein